MIRSDVVECVIGVAAGLFYNSPMEACIVVCRNNKNEDMIGKVKIIDAKKEFVKNGKDVSLSVENIAHIVRAYNSMKDEEGFSKIVSNKDILDNDSKLTIVNYINNKVEDRNLSLKNTYSNWKKSSRILESLTNNLIGD